MIRTEKTLANFTFFFRALRRTPGNLDPARTHGNSRSVNLRSEVWVEGRTSPQVRDGRETSIGHESGSERDLRKRARGDGARSSQRRGPCAKTKRRALTELGGSNRGTMVKKKRVENLKTNSLYSCDSHSCLVIIFKPPPGRVTRGRGRVASSRGTGLKGACTGRH